MVVELQHNIGWPLSNEPRVSEYLHVVEDEGLVPGRVQRRPQLLRRLAEVQEGDVSVRICEWEKINKKDIYLRLHVFVFTEHLTTSRGNLSPEKLSLSIDIRFLAWYT